MALLEASGPDNVTGGVPPERQTMPVDRVFWSHFSPNLGPGGWVSGVLLVHLGLGPLTGIAAILVGNILGALPVALAAVIGPRTGLTQMEASRRVLGVRGLRLPSALNWIYCVGWDAVNNVPAAAALGSLLLLFGVSVPFWAALGVLALCQMAASIYGHDLVQALQKFLGAPLLVAFIGIGIISVGSGGIGAAYAPVASWPNIVLATAVIASFNLSWASYSSDYTRYLPATTAPGRIVRLALAGLLCSSAPFQILGLLTAGGLGEGSPLGVIDALRDQAGVLGWAVLAVIALSSITGNSVNDNTAAYSLISAGLHLPRTVAALLTATLGYVLAVAGAGSYADFYARYLVLTMYWLAPWSALVLADWYLRPPATLRTDARAGRDWTLGATIFVVTTVATIVLFATSEVYTGPVARLLGGADIGYYVGFAAAFLAYAWLAPRAPSSPNVTS